MHREESLSAWVGHGSPVEGTQEAIDALEEVRLRAFKKDESKIKPSPTE